MEDIKEDGKLSRKEKEYLFRRREILDAALKLFATKGYAGTSMQEIATASEFSIGTLYNFFSIKEELYLTLLEEKFIESRVWIERKVEDEENSLEKIHAAVKALLSFMDNNREIFTLFFTFQVMPDIEVHEGIHEKVQKYYEEHIDYFRGLMEECVKDNYFREIEPSRLALTLIGITNAWIYNWLSGPGDESLQGQHELIWDLFINGAGTADGKGKKL